MFKTADGQPDWFPIFFTSAFAPPVALYIFTAVNLYADLLYRSVGIAVSLEAEIFEEPQQWAHLFLTNQLDRNPLAGGKGGTWFYSLLVKGLYVAASVFSGAYLHKAVQARPLLEVVHVDPWLATSVWLALWLILVPMLHGVWYRKISTFARVPPQAGQ